MWAITGYCLTIWFKITAALIIGLAVAALVWGLGSGPFWLAVLAASLLELATIRGLARHWALEARYSWWWFG